MARKVRNPKIDTRSARSKLAVRREPYWTVISKGCAFGYRRAANGGTWVARFRDDAGKQHYLALGAADDARDADKLTVFDFAQAQERARDFFTRKARELAGDAAPDDGPLTVAKALEAYFAERSTPGAKGFKGLAKDRAAANVRILPTLGEMDVAKLTTKRIRDWHIALGTAPKLTRSSSSGNDRKTTPIDPIDAARARRATANRTLTILKAALNRAYQDGRAASADAWRKVKPFKEADAPIEHFLSDDECVRLVNACNGSFRDLVRAALLTGCRYGELTRLRYEDFHPEGGTVTVQFSKAGKPRHVGLTDEGRALFDRLTTGRARRDRIFVRDDGNVWGASHQQRPIEAASARARIEPSATFHILRHTYASSLARRGVPMAVIAAQLGHADTRMTERHYAHLAPSYVADTVRAALPPLGIVDKSNVAPLRRGTAE